MSMSTSRLRNMRLRAMARRSGTRPMRAKDSSNPLHPSKSSHANKFQDVTFKSSATEGSPSQGVIVLVIIPPGAKEGSKVRISPRGRLQRGSASGPRALSLVHLKARVEDRGTLLHG
ncbi:hypothetical protein THAOC_17800 [Thalassiosira oceanica]|uniref:Chaperone DnaJ C-terminal domain-containing protein n=1 Tax=Thalassiosira oceanica TaxID=159749 RepID=K0S9U7_THAOC|nr:hypothetical protein THAOC_17800 [Thalassiosira oceanica]|eukprot:EJK61669.1 hypothetical protein THAOC_17800 [Thalassiosira oceanica]